jgi:Domain of unknown function (DUF4263)
MAYSVTLPGLRDQAENLPREVAPRDEYERLLALAWRNLLESPAGQVEANLQAFLEHQPCLLPGFRSMDIESGHGPYPAAVIREPKLPGLTTRRPDFCWIATDSERINPVLIEIETPDKQWFVHDGRRRGEQHRTPFRDSTVLAPAATWLPPPGPVNTSASGSAPGGSCPRIASTTRGASGISRMPGQLTEAWAGTEQGQYVVPRTVGTGPAADWPSSGVKARRFAWPKTSSGSTRRLTTE